MAVLQEKKYTFDLAFGDDCPNSTVYTATIAPMIRHVISGHNCTVFAYGATGSGKTHTMVGTTRDPGLMIRSMESLFAGSAGLHAEEHVAITASYLEVYNEVRVTASHAERRCWQTMSIRRRVTIHVSKHSPHHPGSLRFKPCGLTSEWGTEPCRTLTTGIMSELHPKTSDIRNTGTLLPVCMYICMITVASGQAFTSFFGRLLTAALSTTRQCSCGNWGLA